MQYRADAKEFPPLAVKNVWAERQTRNNREGTTDNNDNVENNTEKEQLKELNRRILMKLDETTKRSEEQIARLTFTMEAMMQKIARLEGENKELQRKLEATAQFTMATARKSAEESKKNNLDDPSIMAAGIVIRENDSSVSEESAQMVPPNPKDEEDVSEEGKDVGKRNRHEPDEGHEKPMGLEGNTDEDTEIDEQKRIAKKSHPTSYTTSE